MKKFLQQFVSVIAALSIIVPSSFAPLTAMADNGGPNGSLSATYNTGTDTLSIAGTYFGAPSDSNSRPGFATFINSNTPDTASIDTAVNYMTPNSASGSFSKDYTGITSAPTMVCVAVYDVNIPASPSGNHSLTPAGPSHNTDNSFDQNGNAGNSWGISVKDGKIDLNKDGDVNSLDDGILGGKTIIDGQVDWTGANGISNFDDSPANAFFGKTVIDGKIDMNASGGISNSDDGLLIETDPAACVAPTIITPPPLDTDSDGIIDEIDNCVDTPNADQADADDDGIGNACDETPNGVGTLTVTKVIEGEGDYTDFYFQIDGGSSIQFEADGTNVLEMPAGTYDVDELEATGYTTEQENCADMIVTNGGNVTCTITNTEIVVIPETCPDGWTGIYPSCYPPIEPTGSIDITKYICPIGTTVTRAGNGVGGAIPAGCVPEEGVTFGYVHGEQGDAGPDYPELAIAAGGGMTEAGSTGGDGEITITNLPATGRYLIALTDGSGTQLPTPDELLGLYCEGDGEEPNGNTRDNQELTFVDEDETSRCVAYNEGDFELPVDMCLNIPENQPTIPVGYQATEGNNCAACTDDSVTIVSDTDVNADGNPAVALTGEVVNGNWQHPAWTASIPGATWIWDADGIDNVLVDELVVFTKTFNVNGPVSNAVLDIAADNSYEVFLNGVLVGSDPSEANYASADQIVIPNANFNDGANTLEVRVTNKGAEVPENPAGVLFKLTVTAGDCASEDNGGGGGDDQPTRLRIKKETPNSYGEFNFTLAGTDETVIDFSIETNYAGDSDSEMFDNIEPDTYTITEHVTDGWELGTILCEREDIVEDTPYEIANGGTVELGEGEEILCTFVNTATTGFVTVTKEVINDNGEQEDADNFTIMVVRENEVIGQAQGSEEGVIYAVSAGEYEVVEDEHGHYEAEYSGDCAGTIAVGEHKECTVINDDRDMTGGSGNNGNNGSVLGASIDTDGSVLGALSCSFLTYEQLISIKNGVGADPTIVKALQEWLNSSQDAGLTVTGVYDQPTKFAIMLLQEKYASEVLTPWGIEKATGNVWQTTAKLIMRLVCGTNVETGALVPFAIQ